jgi:hypothetical protein
VSAYSDNAIVGRNQVRPRHRIGRLIDRDLIAFDGTRFQVLSLPPRPVVPPAAGGDRGGGSDPSAADIRRVIRA